MSRERLQFEYDLLRDALTVEGVKFSGDFFRFFAMPNEGALFRIIRQQDGEVVVQTVER